MSEFPNKWWKKTEFSSVVLSIFSLILSHPLYFCYLIFFSPYILKILSFLSPLFITTFLLLFALFTTTTLVHDNSNTPQSSQLKLNFLLTTYHNILEKLRSSNAGHDHEEFLQFEEFEAYKIVFEASALELLEQQQQQQQQEGSALEEPVDKYPSHESYVSDDQPKITNINDDVNYEIMHSSETTLEEPNYKGEEASMKSGSKAIESKISQVKEINGDHNGVVECLSKARSKSQRLGSDQYTSTLGSFGSMRKEKEWKRTLACKLFEERHSVNVDGIGGAEGMDLLWETYEGTDSNNKKKLSKSKTNKVAAGKRYEDDNDEDDDDEEEEEEELDNGQLCCLQALKFSAGKMGRPNLVKFSKALKGFGWLHHVTKHGNKKDNQAKQDLQLQPIPIPIYHAPAE
ncbi:hypothetical protein EZV62_019393 [Acer yangbiense]|uniref:Uncharacterized protein n=1 Tax=Acer yangbiense TaxID=1000413 RepID=A0A5C7HB54_9ROSI|nr:hypothetical protein EZV62_019393 [Acer yangbiense]